MIYLCIFGEEINQQKRNMKSLSPSLFHKLFRQSKPEGNDIPTTRRQIEMHDLLLIFAVNKSSNLVHDQISFAIEIHPVSEISILQAIGLKKVDFPLISTVHSLHPRILTFTFQITNQITMISFALREKKTKVCNFSRYFTGEVRCYKR